MAIPPPPTFKRENKTMTEDIWLELCMAVLGDEVGDMTPNEFVDKLVELREKAHLWDVSYDQTLKDAHRATNDANMKLEAIKKLVEKGPHPHDDLEDYQQAVDDWLSKMMNVLEGED